MKYAILILTAATVLSFAACKSEKTTKDGFKVLPDGLEMKLTEDKGTPNADSGSTVKMHVTFSVDDSLIFDSRKVPNAKPIEQKISPSRNVADLMNGLMLMSAGDKGTFRVVSDSIFKDPSMQKPPFITTGNIMQWEVEMIEVKTAADLAKANEEVLAKEAGVIEKYIADNKLDAIKTQSGMYIVTVKEGTGETPKTGQEVTMNYTGRLLDGTVFDSNEDIKFNHVDPFKFVLGTGRVIKGWDEGVALLKKGGKAKLIIPSGMAYGSRAMPGQDANPKGIPANSPLVFDVTLISFKDATGEQPKIQLN